MLARSCLRYPPTAASRVVEAEPLRSHGASRQGELTTGIYDETVAWLHRRDSASRRFETTTQTIGSFFVSEREYRV